MHKFHLVEGPHQGKTINLGGYQFIEGVYTMPLEGDASNVMPSDTDRDALAVYLEKSYGAVLEGSTRYQAVTNAALLARGIDGATAPGALVPNSSPRDQVPTPGADGREQGDGERLPNTVDEGGGVGSERKLKGQVRTALTRLDPKADADWTSEGLPSVARVRELADLKEVSRADIESLAPNLNREEALKLIADGALD